MITRLSFGDYLKQTHQLALQNVHGTVVFRPDALIRVEPGQSGAARYAQTVQDVSTVLGEALAAGKRLRCLGRRWSLSPVATTDGWLLDLSDTTTARWLAPADLTPELAAGRDIGHLLVAAGASIRWVNWSIHRAGWSLQTSGASNGQAVAGAIATGTHGSSIRVGALHDTVAAIHVVRSPTEHWWVEQERAPLTTDEFAPGMGAKLVRDDELFQALQTSLGSLGVVVGVVFRCVRNFWLRLKRYNQSDGGLPAGRLSIPQLIDRMAAWQFDALVNQPAERIWHFDAVFNPYMPDKQCYVSAYVTDTQPAGGAPPNVTGEFRGDEWSPDVLQFVARLAGNLAGGPGLGTKIGLKTEYTKPVPNTPQVWGSWFTGQDLPGGALALSLGVDCERLSLALNTVLQTVQAEGKAPCVVATRFVPGSNSLLAMNRFERTCMIDIDGPNLPAMGELLTACCSALESARVPFTMHWGKWIGYLTRSYVERVYGDRLTRWQAARARLLPDPQLAGTFSNEALGSLVL
jgi:FAD binding domain-containing protein